MNARFPCLSLLGVVGVLTLAPACVGQVQDAGTVAGDGVGSPSGSGNGNGSTGAGSQPGTPDNPGAPGSGGTPTLACRPGEVSAGAGKWRRLTTQQYRNSVRDLVGVAPDTSAFLLDTTTGPFATNAALAPGTGDIEQYAAAAEKLAVTVTSGNLANLIACNAAAMGEDVCAGRFIADFGARAYRRPLLAEERTALLAVYAVGKEENFAAGIRLVIEAALQSPSFLYLQEMGSGSGAVVKLTGAEVASRLSYLLWNSMPDSTLAGAAAAGALDNEAGIRTQAERMLGSQRFLETVGSFFAELLGTGKLSRAGVVSKDPAKYPEFEGLKPAMLDETNRFVAHVFGKGDGTLTSLLSASYSFPGGMLARLYNAPAPQGDGRVDFADGSRYGILTHASVLAAQPAVQTHYQAVLRGKSVRFNLLCQEIAPPPVGVDFTLPPNADKLSQQQLLRAHQDNPSCRACHALMDNIGFGFENYDSIGRYRTTAVDGSAIDASGNVMNSDVEGNFVGVKQLTEKLAQSKDVRACMAKQWFRYALAREPSEGDRCSLAGVSNALGAGGGNVRDALLALVTSPAFRHRRAQ